ncbi:transcription elongation factor [Martiniozyma asiatica (nom. inval.)]|nr:transcription elongation factor [Martiniozyma asiatica]
MSEQHVKQEESLKEEDIFDVGDIDENDFEDVDEVEHSTKEEDGNFEHPVKTDEDEIKLGKQQPANDNKNEKEEDDDEDEDDDDDEDDDEDDEDEDETSRGRKKRRAGNQFLDVEAEVDDDDEEEEEDEDAELLRQEFLADEQGDVELNEESRAHRKLDRSREKLDEQDAQALADEFKARYGRSTSSRYMGSTQNVSQRLLLPSVDDPLIWGIRVRNGKEKEIVKQLHARMLHMRGADIYSAFQRNNFVGYIYVEARKLEAVDKILQGLPNIYQNQGKILVPIEEYPDLLRPGRSDEVRLKPGAYIRVKTGRYKGDLGIVDNLAENDLEVRVKLIPRLDYGRNTVIDPTTGKKKTPTYNATHRPPQRLFSDIEAQRYDHEHLTTSKRERNYFVYKNEEYIDGFLYKDIKLNQLETKRITPTLAELQLFNSGNGSSGLDLHSVSTIKKNAEGEAVIFQPNDRVQITTGEQAKMKGKILSIADAKIARVLLEGNDNDPEVNETIVEAPTSSLRKIFVAGDHVTVIHGAHKDESGLIVDVKENNVTLVSDQTKKDITVFPNYLVRSTDSATTSSKVGRFELHQMVNLRSHQVAMIIKVEKEIFTVLGSDGRVESVEPKQILSVLKTNRMTEKTTDRNGLEIKVGDVVKEAYGEKRQGNIMHVYKTHLFLHSKTVIENTGIFVTDSNSVQTISNKGSIASQFKAPDLNKMNPDRLKQPTGAPQVQAKLNGRDFTLNCHVSVRKGPYKGKRGIIKDANGESARVEMHNPAKIIPINKSDLLYEQKSGNFVPYEVFLESRGRRGGPARTSNPPGRSSSYAASNGSSWSGSGASQSWGSGSLNGNGGKTPSWSSGGKTPAWGSGGASNHGNKTPAWGSASSGGQSAWGSGGKTPAWGSGGKTPAWGDGGKTPAWGDGGKTPAWGDGGKTPAWGSGGKTPAWGDGGKTPSWGSGGKTPAWGSGN